MIWFWDWLIEACYTAYADWLRYGVGPGGYHLEWHWQGRHSDDKPLGRLKARWQHASQHAVHEHPSESVGYRRCSGEHHHLRRQHSKRDQECNGVYMDGLDVVHSQYNTSMENPDCLQIGGAHAQPLRQTVQSREGVPDGKILHLWGWHGFCHHEDAQVLRFGVEPFPCFPWLWRPEDSSGSGDTLLEKCPWSGSESYHWGDLCSLEAVHQWRALVTPKVGGNCWQHPFGGTSSATTHSPQVQRRPQGQIPGFLLQTRDSTWIHEPFGWSCEIWHALAAWCDTTWDRQRPSCWRHASGYSERCLCHWQHPVRRYSCPWWRSTFELSRTSMAGH